MNQRLLLALLPLAVAAGPLPAGAADFRILIGAPPDANYQDFSYDGMPVRPPRGYSSGYGWAPGYFQYPSYVFTAHDAHAPMMPPGPPPAAPELVVPPTAAVFRVRVPENADVFFSGQATTQRGPDRVFMTPPLAEGKPVVFDVQATWKQDGKDVGRARKVSVQAGDRITVDFLQPDAGDVNVLPAPRPVGK